MEWLVRFNINNHMQRKILIGNWFIWLAGFFFPFSCIKAIALQSSVGLVCLPFVTWSIFFPNKTIPTLLDSDSIVHGCDTHKKCVELFRAKKTEKTKEKYIRIPLYGYEIQFTNTSQRRIWITTHAPNPTLPCMKNDVYLWSSEVI